MRFERRLLLRERGTGVLGKLWRIPWLYVLLLCAVAAVGYVALYSAGGGAPEPYAARHAIRFGFGLVLTRGERGRRALFLLPAVLFTVAMAIFPTFFGLYIAFTDWNLSSVTGRHFNGLDNLRALIHDAFFWNALGNMVWYVLAVLVQYAIAFGLALLLNAGQNAISAEELVGHEVR